MNLEGSEFQELVHSLHLNGSCVCSTNATHLQYALWYVVERPYHVEGMLAVAGGQQRCVAQLLVICDKCLCLTLVCTLL
jgi:hypothetical protein